LIIVSKFCKILCVLEKYSEIVSAPMTRRERNNGHY
jgi:hypothetical protein